MKKRYQNLLFLGVVAWVLLSFMFLLKSTGFNFTFRASVRSIFINSSIKLDQVTASKPPTVQQTLNESWLNKVVRGLWMGRASSDMLSSCLQKIKENYTDINQYKVNYTGHLKEQRDMKQLLCQLKQLGSLRTLTGSEKPFASLGWQNLVPRQPLKQAISSPYRTCALVSSAASILNSSLGQEIDSHDVVLRLNAAPTEGFDSDVGSKTTIRIINSQIMAEPQYKFAYSHLYKNNILVAWDPGPYSGDLEKWFKSPDYDLFTAYVEHRKRSPSQPFYILHPDFLWNLWDILQSNTEENIHPNPPSSGFIGIILLMSICENIDVYEYIPSKRYTTLCHYYEPSHDLACTLGAYHPLFYEKLFIRRMTTVSLDELMTKGKISLSGFSQITC